MDKYKLTRFIDKYHLGGNVNAVEEIPYQQGLLLVIRHYLVNLK